VASFLAKEEMEDILLRWMHKVISAKPAFTVALNNYGGSTDAGTIHLRVQDHTPFAQLARELRVIDELVRSNGLPAARLVSHPCLTVAGNLSKTGYEKALRVFAAREFHSEFEVKELVLIKRVHEFDTCRQVNIFRLQP
jgi:2'-5' RNA ligase